MTGDAEGLCELRNLLGNPKLSALAPSDSSTGSSGSGSTGSSGSGRRLAATSSSDASYTLLGEGSACNPNIAKRSLSMQPTEQACANACRDAAQCTVFL